MQGFHRRSFFMGLAGLGLSAPAHAQVARARPPLPLVVLDPGHGGADPGAIGPGGTQEKRVTLPIALEI